MDQKSLRQVGFVALLECAALAVPAGPARAQQTINASWAQFMLRNQGRAETDVLLIEHHDLVFEIGDFSGAMVGGEWLVAIGDRFEAGAGVTVSRRTVPTVHGRAFDAGGAAIPRTLALRQVPIAFTARVLPLGQTYRVQPYAGGGIAVIAWRFSESGDFAIQNERVFRDEEYSATGSAVGPVLLFGLRVAGDRLAFGAEGRYQHARGSFGPSFARVIDPDIDLHGWTAGVTVGLRIGR